MKDFLLFSGSSNRLLAGKVADQLKISLGDVEITRFIDNECRVYVRESVEDKRVFVLQSLSEVADQHLVELCLMATAMKDLKSANITAVIPWMGYSKQDKAFRRGEAVSAQLVAKFIETAGFNQVMTCELHSEKILPYFRIPVVELSTHKLFVRTLKRNVPSVVVSPDMGGRNRSEAFAKEVGMPIVYLMKKRDLTSGDVTITAISERVDGKDCIIFDDIINSGATAIKSGEYLKKHGAKHIFLFATHGVLAGDAVGDLSSSYIDKIIITDTIAIPSEKKFDKLQIVSVAPILANAIMSS
jgi:ribose-phosphate pyrophosphokinase